MQFLWLVVTKDKLLKQSVVMLDIRSEYVLSNKTFKYSDQLTNMGQRGGSTGLNNSNDASFAAIVSPYGLANLSYGKNLSRLLRFGRSLRF